MELHINCTFDMEGNNVDIEDSTVSGIVTLNNGQKMTNSSCKQTKEVTIYNSESTEMYSECFIGTLIFLKYSVA